MREAYDLIFEQRAGRDEGMEFDLAGTDEDGQAADLPQILDPKRYSEGLRDTLFLHGVCIALRRSVAEQFDYIFDPGFFAYAEDLDLGLRVRALGYRSVIASRAVVYHKHTLKTELSWGTAVKTVRIIRNRYLAFYKVMAWWEFALMVPLMSIGAPFNASEFGLSRSRQLLYGLALVPATVAALAVTLVQLPRYAAKRRSIRDRAAAQGAWCLRAIWRRGQP